MLKASRFTGISVATGEPSPHPPSLAPNLVRYACAGLGLLGPAISSVTCAAEGAISPVVYSWVSQEYQRERLADGSLRPEFYAISNGGRVPGTTGDSTVDKITYPEIATIAMQLLAGQGYRYGMTADQAKLLIVLQWGETIPYNRFNYEAAMETLYLAMPADGGDSPALDGALMRMRSENDARAFNNRANAWLLGYSDDIGKANGPLRYAGFGDRYYDLLNEIEESRYYIIVSAYDFHEALKQGKPKLLWVTRVSVFTRRNQFDGSFATMLRSAANYFGRESGGLVRDADTKARVNLGEMKVLGPVEESPAAAPGQTAKTLGGARTKGK